MLLNVVGAAGGGNQRSSAGRGVAKCAPIYSVTFARGKLPAFAGLGALRHF